MSGALVIHPGALGDVLQAVPALCALRADGAIAFAGQPRIGELLRELALADSVLSFDALGLSALFTREPLPLALAERLQSYARVVSWFGARENLYRERLAAASRAAMVASPVPGDESSEPVWRHLLATIGRAAHSDPSPLEVPSAQQEAARRALERLGLGGEVWLLVVHPGAGGAWKRWPVVHLARVIEGVRANLPIQVLVHQGPADRDAADELVRALPEPAPRLVEPELPLLAGILGRAGGYLGGDSGVSHLAAAVGAPATILFPAATRDRWTPWSPTARVLAAGTELPSATAIAAAVTATLRAATSASR